MAFFDQLVAQAMRNDRTMAALQPVVEKEILHHDILREMSHAGLLSQLTFIGGTCLRCCYGSLRLSEDLDFTGGEAFDRQSLHDLGRILESKLALKYGLKVTVNAPVKDDSAVSTWKITVVTRPAQKHLPVQRIHIDICAIPSYDRRPVLLRNPYAVDLGTSGLIMNAQSREEILADKFIALAFRPNRIKNRDLWDIVWLKQQGLALPKQLLPAKVIDHRQTLDAFLELLKERVLLLQTEQRLRKDFSFEMRRFLPAEQLTLVENSAFWTVLTDMIATEVQQIDVFLNNLS